MRALARHRAFQRIWASDPGLWGWFTTVNHTDLGRMFVVASLLFLAVGGLLAMLIRAQLASPRSPFLEADAYAQVFTMHGTIMMFLFAIPLLEGVAVYLLPKMLGTRDMAFPRLSAYGFWCYALGGSLLVGALVAGVAPNAGWFMYPPLSSTVGTPGINSDVWLLGITFVEISAISAAVEIVVSILRVRAPGMSLDKLPVYAWYMLVVGVMILTGFPPMILGSILLELERAFGLPFFTPALGGDPTLWQHLFWLFGHPEVYIIFLPAAGVISTILPVMARTTLLGYAWVVSAAVALGVLSFGLWVHHMFTTGIPHLGLAFFSAASTLVAVPTAIQIFAWIGTLWRGRPELKLPMLWILAFFATFVIGGLTGVMVAVVPFDWQVHDTYFVVAHLHYVLVGGFLFPMLAGLSYWLPHVTGRKRFFKLGETAFWLTFLGFHGTFLALHWVGLMGQRRRVDAIDPNSGWEAINLLSSIGGFVMTIGLALVALDMGINAWVASRGPRNPWRAGTLEWAMPTPPPAYNFASLPEPTSRDPLHDDPSLATRLARGEGWLGDPGRDRREVLAVDVATGRPVAVMVLPWNTSLPLLTALVTGSGFVAMLLKLYWAVPIAALGVLALALRWAWSTGSARAEGPVEAAPGRALPLAAETADPPGWWGSLFLIVADATFLGSLLFGYAFLFTIAPNWPPAAWAALGPLGPALLLAGLLLAPTGLRLAERRGGGGLGPWLSALGGVALAVAGGTLLPSVDPLAHAYGATLWVMGGVVMLHGALAALLSAWVAVRAARGYVGPGRMGELRIARLWADWAVAVALLALGAAWLPLLALP